MIRIAAADAERTLEVIRDIGVIMIKEAHGRLVNSSV
jgi:hypothetical protein